MCVAHHYNQRLTSKTFMWKTWYMYVVCSKIQEKRLVFVLVDKINSMCGYRGGDWLDFAANSTGALLASLVAYYVVRPRMMKQ